MRRNKKQRRIMTLLILILGITIGFALLSTTLYINGTASVKSNTWNIHWNGNSIAVTQGSVSATTPEVVTTTSTDDTVSFNVNLELPGEFYEFTIDAINEGSIDGALNLLTTKIYDSNNQELTGDNIPNYLEYSVKYSNGETPADGDVLEHGTSKKYRIRVGFKSTATTVPASDEVYQVKVVAPYIQYREVVEPTIVIPTGRTKDTLVVGDDICIKSECFDFIRYDGNNVVMLAQYNLKVGGIIENYSETGQIPTTADGYGLQSSEAGGNNNTSSYQGTVAFSTTNYWSNETTYPLEVYNSTVNAEPDFSATCDGSTNCWNTSGYSIAYYVERYKTILEGYGATIGSARLLTYEEATNSSIGCDQTTYKCTAGFITNSSFWLGSASTNNRVWRIYSNNDFYDNFYGYNQLAGSHTVVGVRPVIVISKDNM